MSHELREYDEQHGREMAWHRLTKVNPELALDNPDFYLRRWSPVLCNIVAKRPDGTDIILPDLKTEDENEKKGTNKEGNQWQALVVETSEIPVPLFVSTPFASSYTPLLNGPFLDLIERSLNQAGLPMAVESVGSVFNRRRVFVSIALPELSEFKVGERQFRAYLNFINSFDMSTPFLANTSNTCTVCNNTLTANLATGGCLVKHTKNMPQYLEKLPDVITEALTVQREFANDFMILASEKVSLDSAKLLFIAFLTKGDELSTRAYNQANRLCELFNRGAGNKGETFADMFSAFTDYYTHESAGGTNKGSEWKQFQSSEFGSSAESKRGALRFLLSVVDNQELLAKALADGEKVLKAYHEKD